jgi:hypothetical protein
MNRPLKSLIAALVVLAGVCAANAEALAPAPFVSSGRRG